MSNKNLILTSCLAALVLGEFIGVMVFYAKLKTVQTYVQPEFAAIVSHNLAACAALFACVDTAVALSIVVLLHRHRSEILSKRTNSMVNRIMVYTVGSGIVTSVFGLAGLATTLIKDLSVFAPCAIMEVLPKRKPPLESCVCLSSDLIELTVYLNCMFVL